MAGIMQQFQQDLTGIAKNQAQENTENYIVNGLYSKKEFLRILSWNATSVRKNKNAI